MIGVMCAKNPCDLCDLHDLCNVCYMIHVLQEILLSPWCVLYDPCFLRNPVICGMCALWSLFSKGSCYLRDVCSMTHVFQVILFSVKCVLYDPCFLRDPVICGMCALCSMFSKGFCFRGMCALWSMFSKGSRYLWDVCSVIHVFQGILLSVECVLYDPSDQSDPYGPDDLYYVCSRIHVSHVIPVIHMIFVICARKVMWSK